MKREQQEEEQKDSHGHGQHSHDKAAEIEGWIDRRKQTLFLSTFSVYLFGWLFYTRITRFICESEYFRNIFFANFLKIKFISFIPIYLQYIEKHICSINYYSKCLCKLFQADFECRWNCLCWANQLNSCDLRKDLLCSSSWLYYSKFNPSVFRQSLSVYCIAQSPVKFHLSTSGSLEHLIMAKFLSLKTGILIYILSFFTISLFYFLIPFHSSRSSVPPYSPFFLSLHACAMCNVQ
jgi:hypothetical protein